MATSKIQCIAVISPTNSPLYVRSFGARDGRQADVRYHLIAHGALDVVEERAGPASAAAGKSAEQYLGLLMTMEDLAIYGFQTSTRAKFLLMLSITDMVVKDLDVITIFRAIHTSYLSHLCSPFHSISPAQLSPDGASAPLPPGEANLPPGRRPIRSALFEKRMERIAGWAPPREAGAGAGAGTAGNAEVPPPPVAKDTERPPPPPAAKA